MTAAMLACPACSWDESTDGAHDFCFRYLEDVTTLRRVEGFSASGALLVAAEERVAEGEPGGNPRLQCGNCLGEFPVPIGLAIDFI